MNYAVYTQRNIFSVTLHNKELLKMPKYKDTNTAFKILLKTEKI